MKVTIYTIENCRNCKILKGMLAHYGVQFEEKNDIEYLLSNGFTSAPCLEVNGVLMDYESAKEWTIKQKSSED